jgi:hypothetical protein
MWQTARSRAGRLSPQKYCRIHGFWLGSGAVFIDRPRLRRAVGAPIAVRHWTRKVAVNLPRAARFRMLTDVS